MPRVSSMLRPPRPGRRSTAIPARCSNRRQTCSRTSSRTPWVRFSPPSACCAWVSSASSVNGPTSSGGPPWPPDVVCVRGEYLARVGEHAQALDVFLNLQARGLPVFADSLSHALNRLRVDLRVKDLDYRRGGRRASGPTPAAVRFGQRPEIAIRELQGGGSKRARQHGVIDGAALKGWTTFDGAALKGWTTFDGAALKGWTTSESRSGPCLPAHFLPKARRRPLSHRLTRTPRNRSPAPRCSARAGSPAR